MYSKRCIPKLTKALSDRWESTLLPATRLSLINSILSRLISDFAPLYYSRSMSSKQVASEVIVVLQNQFRDKIAENVQRFLSKVDKRRLGDSTMGTASTNLIMSMNRTGNWYAASLEKVIRKETKEFEVEKKKSRVPRAPNPALTRKYVLTDSMSDLMGSSSATRQDVLKRMYAVVVSFDILF